MGHYRSEMGYEDEDERLARKKAELRDKMAAKIEADVKERGIGAVLADILSEPIHYKLSKY